MGKLVIGSVVRVTSSRFAVIRTHAAEQLEGQLAVVTGVYPPAQEGYERSFSVAGALLREGLPLVAQFFETGLQPWITLDPNDVANWIGEVTPQQAADTIDELKRKWHAEEDRAMAAEGRANEAEAKLRLAEDWQKRAEVAETNLQEIRTAHQFAQDRSHEMAKHADEANRRAIREKLRSDYLAQAAKLPASVQLEALQLAALVGERMAARQRTVRDAVEELLSERKVG